jgi:hypothetical protein
VNPQTMSMIGTQRREEIVLAASRAQIARQARAEQTVPTRRSMSSAFAAIARRLRSPRLGRRIESARPEMVIRGAATRTKVALCGRASS